MQSVARLFDRDDGKLNTDLPFLFCPRSTFVSWSVCLDAAPRVEIEQFVYPESLYCWSEGWHGDRGVKEVDK